jgi:hypothetical protein
VMRHRSRFNSNLLWTHHEKLALSSSVSGWWWFVYYIHGISILKQTLGKRARLWDPVQCNDLIEMSIMSAGHKCSMCWSST